jgi:phage shock protein A
MGGSETISFRTIERVLFNLRRRLISFLELSGAEPAPRGRAPEAEALRARLGRAVVERRRVERELAAMAPDDFSAKAERAIELGREDLARAALARGVARQTRRAEIDAEIAALDREIAVLETSLGPPPQSEIDAIERRLAELNALLQTSTADATAER